MKQVIVEDDGKNGCIVEQKVYIESSCCTMFGLSGLSTVGPNHREARLLHEFEFETLLKPLKVTRT